MNTETVLQILLGGTGGTVTLVALARWLMKNYRSEKIDRLIAKAEEGAFSRLEGEVKALREEVKQLKDELAKFRKDELMDMADLSTIKAFADHLPCGNNGCPGTTTSFDKMKKALNDMYTRKTKVQVDV